VNRARGAQKRGGSPDSPGKNQRSRERAVKREAAGKVGGHREIAWTKPGGCRRHKPTRKRAGHGHRRPGVLRKGLAEG